MSRVLLTMVYYSFFIAVYVYLAEFVVGPYTDLSLGGPRFGFVVAGIVFTALVMLISEVYDGNGQGLRADLFNQILGKK